MASKTHPRLRVAAVQAAPVFLDLDGTLDKTVDLIAQAAGQGVQLLAFPETWAPGYPWWIWLDSPAWGMQFVQRYHDNALVVDQRLRDVEAARSLLAVAERDPDFVLARGLAHAVELG